MPGSTTRYGGLRLSTLYALIQFLQNGRRRKHEWRSCSCCFIRWHLLLWCTARSKYASGIPQLDVVFVRPVCPNPGGKASVTRSGSGWECVMCGQFALSHPLWRLSGELPLLTDGIHVSPWSAWHTYEQNLPSGSLIGSFCCDIGPTQATRDGGSLSHPSK